MKYFSLNQRAPKVSFKDAVINGLAPDKGLYFPENIIPLNRNFLSNLEAYSNEDIAFEVIQQFIGVEIPETDLRHIIQDTISFDFPVKTINNRIGTLELFHGPTMAFKDVGARFMARCLRYFNTNQNQKVTVLVATSGDTGGAVAHGFLNVDGVEVVILYPSQKVSAIQEKQLTTLGNNITALEVEGTFDDCQDMVKTAFLDSDIKGNLTSANSINIARWLPQMFYFFFAYKQLYKQHKNIVFSVPSGNFGNICAGLLAQKLGLPIRHFIASTNINDTVPKYMENGDYIVKASQSTLSNAMDVGNPSNFIRILQLFNNDFESLKSMLSSYSFSDNNTKMAMEEVYKNYNYIMDPHGAIGYLGLTTYGLKSDDYGIFLETAHPIKFKKTVEATLTISLEIPNQIETIMDKEKKSITISHYDQLKKHLNDH